MGPSIKERYGLKIGMVQAIAHPIAQLIQQDLFHVYFRKNIDTKIRMAHRIWWCWQKKGSSGLRSWREAFSDIGLSRRQLGRGGIFVYTEEFPQHSFSIILLTFLNNRVGWGESYWKPLFYIYWKEIIFGLFWTKHSTMFDALKQTPGRRSLPTLPIPPCF